MVIGRAGRFHFFMPQPPQDTAPRHSGQRASAPHGDGHRCKQRTTGTIDRNERTDGQPSPKKPFQHATRWATDSARVLGGIRWEEDRIPPHGHAVPKFRVDRLVMKEERVGCSVASPRLHRGGRDMSRVGWVLHLWAFGHSIPLHKKHP